MKRLSLTIAFLALVVLSGRTHAQKWYFYESFDNVAVDATGSGYVPDGFTLYNDDNVPFDGKPDLSYFDMAWKVMRGMDGEGCVSSPSLFKNNYTQADRWLVTPAISLQDATAPTLYFRAKAGDDQMRDGLVLKISSTTTEQSAFKNIRSMREVPGSWTDYVFDLSEYAGQTVYLAFVQNSTGMLTLSIDDIRVGEAGNGLTAVCNNAYTPLYMIHTHEGSNMSFPISATLQNWSDTKITSARLCVRMNKGPVSNTTFNNLIIGPATATSLPHQTVSFNFVPQEADKNAEFEIWFDQINGQSVSMEHTKVNCFVAEEAELPCKQVLLETFSSATCFNCGPWNKLLHTWDSILGGNDMSRPEGFVAAKFQVNIPYNGDPLVTDETEARRTYYNINATPRWMMNGRRFLLRGGTEENIEQNYQNILDSLAKYQRTLSPISIQAKLNVEGQTLTTEVKSTAKLPIQGNYRLYVVLIEDSIHQTAQMSGETEFYNIVRKMLPNANGTPLKTPQPTDNDMETTYAFDYTIGDNPTFYGSLDRVGVIAYIQNTATKEIIQATYASANGEWSKTSAWINDSISYTLTLIAQPDEGGIVSGADVYAEGSSVTITATANAGYKFVAWMDGESELSKEPVYKFHITANATYTAIFEAKKHYYNLTLTASPVEGGLVEGTDQYPEGDEVTISAKANTGYKFVAWMDGESELSKEPVYKFRITANATYTATFEAKQHYNLTLTASPVEGGLVEGTDQYPEGDEVTISAKANTGYKFVAWTNGSDTLSKIATYQFPMPAADVTYTAVFANNTSTEDMVRASFSVSTDHGQLIVRNLNGTLVKDIDIYSLTGERLVRFSPNSREDLSLPVAAKRTLCIVCINTENGAAVYKISLP